MKAVCDVDNVLADFEEALVERLCEIDPIAETLNRDLYSLEKRYEMHPKLLDAALSFTERPSSYGFALKPIYTGVKFVNELISRGWEVLFLSARPGGSAFRNQTSRWLEHYIDDYYNTRGCLLGVSAKVEITEEWGGILVDDNPDLVEFANKRGTKAYAWDQPWNEGVFPRLVCDREGTVYIWKDEATEEVPFFSVYEMEAE